MAALSAERQSGADVALVWRIPLSSALRPRPLHGLDGLSDGIAEATWQLVFSARYALIAAGEGGINFFDTAINYRNQRSERCIGAALERLQRDEIVVCTKAGFLVPGAVPMLLQKDEVAGGMHCISPEFLTDQIERMCDPTTLVIPSLADHPRSLPALINQSFFLVGISNYLVVPSDYLAN